MYTYRSVRPELYREDSNVTVSYSKWFLLDIFLLLILSQFYMQGLSIKIGIIARTAVARSSQVASVVATVQVRYGIAVRPHEFRSAAHMAHTLPGTSRDRLSCPSPLIACLWATKEGLIQLLESMFGPLVRYAYQWLWRLFSSKVPKRSRIHQA